MLQKLIIVVDLQRFKLFATKQDPLKRESIELIQSVESSDTHQKLSEKVSDQKENFKSAGGSGSGEDHNLVLEWERRRIKEIAEQILSALQEHNHEIWYFAAPKAINNKILDLLSADDKKNMKINLHSDLTKIPNSKLLEHFSK